MLAKVISVFINNFRRGFATNSSSSHSLVYYRAPQGRRWQLGEEIKYNSNDIDLNKYMFLNVKEKLMIGLQGVMSRCYWELPIASNDNNDEGLTFRSVSENYYKKIGYLFPEFDVDDFENALNNPHDFTKIKTENMIETTKILRDSRSVVFNNEEGIGTILKETKGVWGASLNNLDDRIYLEDEKQGD